MHAVNVKIPTQPLGGDAHDDPLSTPQAFIAASPQSKNFKQEVTDMLTTPTIETFTLTETKDKKITLTAYVAGATPDVPPSLKRRAVLICPGGSYRYCSNTEGEPIALAYLSAGFNAFVLDYSVTSETEKGKKFPGQLIEAAMAMKFIKDNAEKFHIDPNYVFVNGYSAGGHLAASLGILYNSDYVKNALDIPENYARPAGMILAYPVITSGKYTHAQSIKNILHEDAENEEARRAVSLETRVDKNTVPAFVWHTRTDALVPVENSLLFASALAENGIPFELHVYPNGPHGLSLATAVVGKINDVAAQWFGESVRWMNSMAI